MGGPSLKAGLVFLFMTFLAAQAGTGFMRDVFAGGVYPRAMRAFDWILATFFIGPLGHAGAAIVLLCLGVVFALMVCGKGQSQMWHEGGAITGTKRDE